MPSASSRCTSVVIRKAPLLVGYGIVAVVVTASFAVFGDGQSDWDRAYGTPLLLLAFGAEVLSLVAWRVSSSDSRTGRQLQLGAALAFTAWTAAVAWVLWLQPLYSPVERTPTTPSMQPVILIGTALALALSALPAVPRWLPWLVPATFAGIYLAEYLDQATWNAGGDPQPGTVLLVGVGLVVVQGAVIVLGHAIRSRSSVAPPQP